jgi:hypothetical protein
VKLVTLPGITDGLELTDVICRRAGGETSFTLTDPLPDGQPFAGGVVVVVVVVVVEAARMTAVGTVVAVSDPPPAPLIVAITCALRVFPTSALVSV